MSTRRDGTAPRFPAPLKPAERPAPRGDGLLRPQRLLHEAARDAARDAAWQSARAARGADNLGLDTARVRQAMVQRLRAEGLHCEPVLDAMGQVPRHAFVDTALAVQAYEDTSLPIGHGQTISKPSVVARMIALLFDGRGARARGDLGRVLEVGTGCGYQTALLARLARHVVSIERVGPLHAKAQAHLGAAGPGEVRLVHGDGMLGDPAAAPFDAIIAAAGGDDLPAAWLDQLAIGGRLVAPTRRGSGAEQVLVVVDRDERGLHRREHEVVLFVPLKSGTV